MVEKAGYALPLDSWLFEEDKGSGGRVSTLAEVSGKLAAGLHRAVRRISANYA